MKYFQSVANAMIATRVLQSLLQQRLYQGWMCCLGPDQPDQRSTKLHLPGTTRRRRRRTTLRQCNKYNDMFERCDGCTLLYSVLKLIGVALKFITHFTGDITQPTAHFGNCNWRKWVQRTNGNRTTNLHTVGHSALIIMKQLTSPDLGWSNSLLCGRRDGLLQHLNLALLLFPPLAHHGRLFLRQLHNGCHVLILRLPPNVPWNGRGIPTVGPAFMCIVTSSMGRISRRADMRRVPFRMSSFKSLRLL